MMMEIQLCIQETANMWCVLYSKMIFDETTMNKTSLPPRQKDQHNALIIAVWEKEEDEEKRNKNDGK